VSPILSDADLDTIFREARTHRKFQDKPVSEVSVRAIYELTKMGPTSFNCSPARFVFVTSAEAKEKLKAVVGPGNVEKVLKAPVTAIVATDSQFYDHLEALNPGSPMVGGFIDNLKKNAGLAESTGFRNGTLQGAYLVIAARALGLDCCPMSGFDNAALDKAFFPDGRYKSNFICAIGHGDTAALMPRLPRLDFDEACSIE
jgi:3-hydroxypropanoate dehydrogenase